LGECAVYVFETKQGTEVTFLTYYLLTAQGRVILEKLTGFQLVKKFLSFHGTKKFITAITSDLHLYLS
jgi:hypothetical protein